jgi:hypothetical protein
MKGHKVLLAALLFAAATSAFAVELNFGGDIGFYLFDVSMGNGILPSRDSLGNGIGTAYDDTTGRINMTFESHGLGLYWNVQLSEKVSVSALTEVGGTTTSATPRLGKKLGTQQGEAGTQKALAVPEAYVQVMLPWDLQLSTGIIRPIFSEDYGMKKGYQEANRLFKSSANAYGGEWHDLGFELYKAFEPGGNISIPTYLYLMAGEEQYGDNNNNKTVMIHVAPEFWKLRVLGSYAFGKYDAENEKAFTRYAAGLGGEFGNFWFRGEYFGGAWDGVTAYNQNGSAIDTVTFTRKPMAYYVKAGYNLIPDKLGLVLTYDQYTSDWTTRSMLGYSSNGSGTTTDASESYTTLGATVQYWVIPGSSILLEYNRAMWKVGDGTLNKLDFNRITLGWRTVF